MKTQLITDGQSLVSAKSRFGHPIPVYDDGFGPLFIHRDSMGISGIVRAQTWEEAYSICEDEFFPAATETEEEFAAEYATEYLRGRELWERENGFGAWQGLTVEERERVYSSPGKDTPFTGHFTDHPCWQEAYGFRPSGPRKVGESPFYVKDLNGDALDLLTPELLASLEITLEIKGEE